MNKKTVFIFIDIICLQAAVCAAFLLERGAAGMCRTALCWKVPAVMLVSQLLVLFFTDEFRDTGKNGWWEEGKAVVKETVLVMLLSNFLFFLMHTIDSFDRITFVLIGIIDAVLSYLARMVWKMVCSGCRKEEKRGRSLVIITNADAAEKVIRNVRSSGHQTFILSGIAFVDQDLSGKQIDGVSVVGTEKTVADYICQAWVDDVLICLPKEYQLSETLMSKLTAMGVTIHLDLEESAVVNSRNLCIERIGSYTVLTVSANRIKAWQLLCKRLMDIVGGLVGCVLTILLTIGIGPLIYLKSPGPVFFSQIRIGKNGKKFRMYKFRSMYTDAEERKSELMNRNKMTDGLMFKVEGDPRIIGSEKKDKTGKAKDIGNFIRRTSIDEFPQFWNVLKGDMSLVGTRPPTVDEWERYEAHHRARMTVKPGITGLWQVSGRNDITDFEEVVRLDRQYIEQWNIRLDMKILLETVRSVAKGTGAL